MGRSYLFVVLVPPAGARRTRDSRHLIGWTAAAAAAMLVAGCGAAAKAYTLKASEPCLSGLGKTTAQADLDLEAADAAGGAIGVEVGGQMVTVTFDNTNADAKRRQAGYKLVSDAFNSPVDDILSRHRNVVVLWERTPSSADVDSVTGCLSG